MEDPIKNHESQNEAVSETLPKKCKPSLFIEELVLLENELSEEETEKELTSLVIEEFTECQTKQPTQDTNSPPQCYHCHRVFQTESKLRKHILVQHPFVPSHCFQCGFTASTPDHLHHHMTSHFPKFFFCDFCAARFRHCHNLLNHLHKHIDNCRKFTCAQCERKFVSKVSLTMHLRTHTGEKPYACVFCNRKFSQLASKQYHERTHTGTYSHFCELCNRGFKSKASRDSHQRIHTGEKPFRCHLCKAMFRSAMSLRQHTLIHSDEKPFSCSVCGKSFGRKEKMRIHARIHTDDKPYACSVCCKRFCQKNDMLKHERSHNRLPKRQSKASSPVSLCYNGQVFVIQD